MVCEESLKAKDIIRDSLLDDPINVLILECLMKLEEQLPIENAIRMEEYEKKKRERKWWSFFFLAKPDISEHLELYYLRQQFKIISMKEFWDRLRKLELVGFIKLWSIWFGDYDEYYFISSTPQCKICRDECSI